jgi:hypothetical protein
MINLVNTIFSFFISVAHAAMGTGGSITLSDPLNGCTFSCVAGNILTGLWEIAVPLLGIMVIIGGFQIMTAGGKEEQFKKGRQTLMYAVIGFVCILIATGVVDIIKSVIGP